MVGAIILDFTKISLLVPSARVEAVLGIPFDWGAIHMLGGTLVAMLSGALLTSPAHRPKCSSCSHSVLSLTTPWICF